MTSKRLLPNGRIRSEREDSQDLRTRYQESMRQVKDGLANDVFDKGSLREKQQFAEQFFTASVLGKQLSQRTGRPYEVPDVTMDAQNRLLFSVETYTPTKEASLSQTRADRVRAAEQMEEALFGDQENVLDSFQKD